MFDKIEYQTLKTKDIPDEEQLNILGEQGWILCTIIPTDLIFKDNCTNIVYFIFYRVIK